jgi:peptidyl-tRNA hydrolase, PTH1 family
VDEAPWLVVGLGNPGPQYAGNRHNVGQVVCDELAARVGGSFRSHRARAAVWEGRLGVVAGGRPGPRVVLAKPSTYMNLSGGPVAGLVRFFDVPIDHVLVVYDELDLPFGTLRLKRGGGEGGHNGVRSLSSSLGTKDFLRLRVGVGRPPGRQDPVDFLLKDFTATERRELPLLVSESADAVEQVVAEGLERTQLRLHAPR